MASFFNRLIKGEKSKSISNTNSKGVTLGYNSAYSVGQTMAYYRCGSYDNTFPNVSRISEAFAEVLPYAVNAMGERMRPQPAIISALYSPNKQMSGVEFAETLMVMALVHPQVRILCWHNEGGVAVAGGTITPDNICGFTFLENSEVEYNINGNKRYKVTNAKSEVRYYSDNEVIELSLHPNPYAILDGYSPSMASKKWANIDDYIAEYQSGFFRNGAVPAGEFVITAPTVKAYDDIVDELQKKHRGAGANNNVVYTYRPVDNLTGLASNATIEWIPFNQSNNEMSLQTLFDQANKKIDMDFGVPQEVKGYLQNSNYASVEVADYVFARRVVYPKLVKIWSKFTHEMNRITGGMGCAISFDYEMPILTETRTAQIDSLLKAINNGFTLDSAVEALKLPKSFLKLTLEGQERAEEEREDVEPTNEGEDADQIDTSMKSVEHCCEHESKAVEPDPKAQRAVEDYMGEQIASAQNEEDFDEEKKSKEFAKKLLAILLVLLQESGNRQYAVGAEMLNKAGYDTDELNGFTVPKEVETTYLTYLEEVSLSYTEDTNKAIKEVLERGQVEGWNADQIKTELANIMETNAWRVTRLASTETHRATQYGYLTAMRELAKETGAEIVKIWNVNPLSPNPCQTCLELDGQRLPLGDDFGEFPAGSAEVADAHPNCSCFLTFEIVDNKKSISVKCPSCGRHLFESDGGTVNGIKCQGCKKHFNFDIMKNKVKSIEVEKEAK